MIVKYMRDWGYQGEGKDPDLTFKKEYLVIGVNYNVQGNLEVSVEIDSDGTPCLFPLTSFDLVDPSLPEEYSFYFYEYGFASLQPIEFKGDFWDRYHDGDPEAEKLFEQVMTRLKKFHGWEA